MSYIDDYVRRIEDVTIPGLKEDIALLRSGKIRTGVRNVPGAWIDTTQEEIHRLGAAIVEYESVLNYFLKMNVLAR